MSGFDKKIAEEILISLEEKGLLFPQFKLRKENHKPYLLGTGGFSAVYEMYNKERPERKYALKVMGLGSRSISSAEFKNTGRIQWLLSLESKYVTRILELKELFIHFDDSGNMVSIQNVEQERWEEEESGLHLQFVLMEKLDPVIEKDKFQKVSLCRKELLKETEVIRFAMEIGQALNIAHKNQYLHRDIKLENIFWDEAKQVYKLGDFGLAKYTEDGNAETIVYTNGYGAPEIERRLYNEYNATADIYSLGISLYVLLNELRFPGSSGYYPKTEIQYSEEFVFPAPVNASEDMAAVIRKMCSYRAKDRYQTVAEVLMALAEVGQTKKTELNDDYLELMDLSTETYREENIEQEYAEGEKNRLQTRAERKEEMEIEKILYREDCLKYYFILTFILALLLKSTQWNLSIIKEGVFWILPAAVMFEGLLQKIKEFHIFGGTILLGILGFSIYLHGFSIVHMVFLLSIILGVPLISFASASATILWLWIELILGFDGLDFLAKYNLGWIFGIAALLIIVSFLSIRKNRYFRVID